MSENKVEKPVKINLETFDEETLQDTYHLIRHINHYVGSARLSLLHLEHFSKKWKKNERINILDVGSGTSGIPEAIANWTLDKNFRISVTGTDTDLKALTPFQRNMQGYKEINLIQCRSPQFPFRDQSFDYVISSTFFHQLANREAVETLRSFDRIAKRGMIITDFLKRESALTGLATIALLSQNLTIQNTSLFSVDRGFRRYEIETILTQSRLDYLFFTEHTEHQFAVVGEKK